MSIDRRGFLAGMLATGAAKPADNPPPGAKPVRLAPIARAGYECSPAGRADETRWVQVDLGRSPSIEAVKLYPAQDQASANGFPVRFQIEASNDPQFTSATLIADHSQADYPSSRDEIQRFGASGIAARYVRLTVTRMRPRRAGGFRFTLAKIDVLSGSRNIAEGRPIADSTSGNLGVTPLTRPPRPMGEGIVTDNPANVTDERDWRPVAYQARALLGGVRLEGGVLRTALENNIAYLLNSWTVDELVRQFRARAGKSNPPGMRMPDRFWEEDLAGSNAGRFLMGAGNALRWVDHSELRDRMNRVVDVIEECRQPNGYIMAYPEETIFRSERAGYTRAWVTHGLIEAGHAGNPKAFGLLRGYYDWFDQCPYLPEMLRGSAQGVQGMIANTRMYFTPVGKPRDLHVVQQYYQENYWLEQLAQREPRAIWQYPYDRPHCYLLTDLEAYLDLYRATGARRYLDAVMGAWDLYHDSWEHVGGSIAICEFDTYRPKSYLLHMHTGELCGSVFWILLNQRLHSLFPAQEKYAAEIEKSIYNVALANQVGSKGILYHAHLTGRKGDSNASWGPAVNTCCAGQGARLFGGLPEFIYSIAADGLYVNLFEASTIAWKQNGQGMELKMSTQFPFKPDVQLRFLTAKAVRATIRLRIPSWAGGNVAVMVNGRQAAVGRPGSYLPLDRNWSGGDSISFVLPMGFRLTRYEGEERVAGQERYALESGPILMALIGEVDEKSGAWIRRRPEDLAEALKPVPDTPLHFAIEGDASHRYMPYWTVSDEVFTCYPAVGI